MFDKPSTAQLPELREEARAVSLARKVPGEGVDFVVGFCDHASQVIAIDTLDSADQVMALSKLLAPLGYTIWALGTASEMMGCDVLYQRRPRI